MPAADGIELAWSELAGVRWAVDATRISAIGDATSLPEGNVFDPSLWMGTPTAREGRRALILQPGPHVVLVGPRVTILEVPAHSLRDVPALVVPWLHPLGIASLVVDDDWLAFLVDPAGFPSGSPAPEPAPPGGAPSEPGATHDP